MSEKTQFFLKRMNNIQNDQLYEKLGRYFGVFWSLPFALSQSWLSKRCTVSKYYAKLLEEKFTYSTAVCLNYNIINVRPCF